jgi:hypothetical protein
MACRAREHHTIPAKPQPASVHHNTIFITRPRVSCDIYLKST